jgi:hypothetical protein
MKLQFGQKHHLHIKELWRTFSSRQTKMDKTVELCAWHLKANLKNYQQIYKWPFSAGFIKTYHYSTESDFPRGKK